MSTYAVVQDGTATNVVLAEQDVATELGLVGPLDGLSPHPGIGWTWDGTAWTAPAVAVKPPSTELATDLTMASNWGLLTETQKGDLIAFILKQLGA